jgi:hypothetical protein
MKLTNHLAKSYGQTLATASRAELLDILAAAAIELDGRHHGDKLDWNHPILEAMVEAPDDEILSAIALVTERLRFNPQQKQQP